MAPRDPDVPHISTLSLRLFTRAIVKRYFRRHFRSVMVQQFAHLRRTRGPTIVYGNHSSWWDPMLLILMAQTALPSQRHYAPMDAAALARYRVFRRLGIFPVELTSGRGAAMFLRTATAVLRSGGILWITPQGRFADPRTWPLGFKPGLGLLAERLAAAGLPDVPLLPMAVEYPFWDERLPEALVRFGDPVHIVPGTAAAEITRQLEQALAAEMLALQKVSIARDASVFETVLNGGRGTGGVYALARRVRCLFTGRSAQPDHTPRAGV